MVNITEKIKEYVKLLYDLANIDPGAQLTSIRIEDEMRRTQSKSLNNVSNTLANSSLT